MSPERTVYSKIKPSSLLLLTPMLMESRVNNAEYAGIYLKKQQVCKEEQVYFKGGGSTQALFPRRKKTEASAHGLYLFLCGVCMLFSCCHSCFLRDASFLPHSKNMPKQIIDTSASNLLFNKR